MKESDISLTILEYLKRKGYFVWRMNSGGFYRGDNFYKMGLAGTPDIIGMTKEGIFLGVEVKARLGRQNNNQKLFEINTINNKGIYILARSLEDVQKAGL